MEVLLTVKETWEACRKMRSSGIETTLVIFGDGCFEEYNVSPKIGPVLMSINV